ncbi:MAG: hypothetical protein ABI461_01970 [Polyangiaceae bacterium]
MSGRPSNWRTAALALRLGIIAFFVISAVILIAQGFHPTAPSACVGPQRSWPRAIPWLIAAVIPLVAFAIVRELAARFPLASVEVGEGPYRRSSMDSSSVVHATRAVRIVIGLLAVVALGVGYTQTRQWSCAFALPAACHAKMKRVAFVPIGDLDPQVVADLAKHFHVCYGLSTVVLPKIDAPKAAWNAERAQWLGQVLTDALPSCRNGDPTCESQLTIGVTDLDMYLKDVDWNFALSTRDPENHAAVVSRFRMKLSGGVGDRATKMIAKDIGLEYCGLETSSNPHSVMRGSIGGLADLDEIDESVW